MRQASLFDDLPWEDAPHVAPTECGEPVAAAPGRGAIDAPACFASVLVDIPTRSLTEPFAYAVPAALAERAQVGCAVLVRFGNRPALGYILALAPALSELPGAAGLDPARVKPLRDVQ